MACGLGGIRILVLEDEYLIADELLDVLTGAGARVALAANCGMASRLLAQEHFDLVVVDLDLGGQSSLGIAAKLEEMGVPFVFATGYDRSVVPDRFSRIPFWGKPFDMSRFAADLGVAMSYVSAKRSP